MNISAFCVKRPAFTIVLSLVLVIIGIISYTRLPLRWIPDVKPPQIWIQTEYPGASPLAVEHDVTKVLEETLSGINGVDTITSMSRRSHSRIGITFKLGVNMDSEVEEVRSRIEQVKNALPKDADSPRVIKADPDSNPIMYIAFFDQHKDARALSDYLDKYVAPTFETLDGVSQVEIIGKRLSAVQVRLDPAKMAGANVTADEIINAIYAQNTALPSGFIKSKDRYYNVLIDNTFKKADDFNNLVLRAENNQVTKLKDVGFAEMAAEDTDSGFRINGQPGIALGIIPQASANPLEVEQNIKHAFADLQKTLPAGMQAKILYNQADYIRASINSVYEALFEAVIFVWLVIFLFLCNFRATLIPIITIPVCLISTFAILYYFHFSINIISLMAFVLAIGLVVDDAIVMLENISRYIEQGLSPYQAALKGSREIIFPIIAMTITLAAVYAPIAFTPGLLGVLFKEFTFSLAGAVIISGIIALTLSPMMCARLLKPSSESGRYQKWFTEHFNRLQERYRSMLTFVLAKRIWVVIISLLLATGLGAGVYKYMPAELSPTEDMEEIDVFTQAGSNASYAYTDQYVQQLEANYRTQPDIVDFLTIHFAPQASFQILILKPAAKRHFKTEQLLTQIDAFGRTLSGVRVNVMTPPPPLAEYVNSNGGESLGMVLMTNGDYKRLQYAADTILAALKQRPGFSYADHTLKWDTEELQVGIDKDRAADLKLNVPTITNTISALIAGRTIGKMDEYDINVSLSNDARANPNIFKQLYARNSDGKMVSLSGVINLNAGATSATFMHYERLRADKLYLSLAPNFKLADAVSVLQKTAQENLPSDVKYTLTGQAKDFLESQGKTLFTFGLALLFIYLILVAQFESFIDPLIILLTVPFAIVGALLTLKLFGGSLNIYSNIGMITLVGLIAKHGILMTEFANQLRREGKSIQEAILVAASLRLRPILMTTAAMVLGALPLAFAMGQGAETRQQVGLVIVGGMLIGTFFSLIIIPVAYSYLAPLKRVTTEHNGEALHASDL